MSRLLRSASGRKLESNADDRPLMVFVGGNGKEKRYVPPVHLDLQQAYDSMLRVRDGADIIVPLHEPSFADMERIPWEALPEKTPIYPDLIGSALMVRGRPQPVI